MKAHHPASAILLILISAACGTGPEYQAIRTVTSPAAESGEGTPTSTLVATSTPTAVQTSTQTVTTTSTATPSQVNTPTLVSIGTVNPELAPERDRFFSDTNAYSLVPPPGWEHNYFQVSNGDTDGWYPPEETPDKTNLGVILLSSKFDLEALKNMWQDNFSQIGVEIESIREDQLTGDTGQTYLRWELSQMAQDGVSYHMTYSFYNSENWSLVLIYMRPDDRGSEYDRIVDETMKTVRLNDSVRP